MESTEALVPSKIEPSLEAEGKKRTRTWRNYITFVQSPILQYRANTQ